MIALGIQLLLCLGMPWVFLRLEHTQKWVRWIGPVILCYATGIVWGNLALLPVRQGLNTQLYEVSAVLAVPLVLFSAHLRQWIRMAGKTLLSFSFCVIAACLSALLAYFWLGHQLDDSAAITAMSVGVFTGGTPNLTAIGVGLGLPGDLIAKANLTDTLVSVPYLLLAFTVLQRILLTFLPAYPRYTQTEETSTEVDIGLPWPSRFKYAGVSLLLGGLCLGLSAGWAALLPGVEQGVVIVISITLLGLLASLIPAIRRWPYTYETGEYLLLIFCVAVGMEMRLDMLGEQVGMLFGIMAITAYGAILIHYTLAWLFKIDADTALITSVAGIFSPVFVAPIARAIHNKEILAAGMTSAVIGYALGNLAGLGIYWLLSSLN